MSKLRHLDLFSGIGGFAYAADQVWDNVEHIFCDNDKFCQQVLNKHWPEAKIYDDIRQIDTNPFNEGLQRDEQKLKAEGRNGQLGGNGQDQTPLLLTGGFPCQPFSAAGLRKGTADERHLWPEMLRVIQLTKPTWVIAENVRGLLTWNEGMVFQQVCTDLENNGYEVQAFIIPAIAVNAPHRRDRVWFVAFNTADSGRSQSTTPKKEVRQSGLSEDRQLARRPKRLHSHATDTTDDDGWSGQFSEQETPKRPLRHDQFTRSSWHENWIEVATRTCGVDDGLPRRMDRLKSLGNAIVPQVAVEIMKGMTV